MKFLSNDSLADMNFVIENGRIEDASSIAAIHPYSLNRSHKAFIPKHLHHLALNSNVAVRTRGWTEGYSTLTFGC